MIRCVPSKVNWNKPISAGTYDGQGLISVDKSRPLLTSAGHKKLILGPRSADPVAIHATGQKIRPIIAYCRPDATPLPVSTGADTTEWDDRGLGIVTRRSGIDGCLL
jgi:hypothetical protein